MAVQHVAVRPDRVESYDAAADLRTSQYLCMVRNTAGQVALSGAGGKVIGILQNEPNTGEAAAVAQSGSSRVVSNGSGTAIDEGDWLKSDGSGKAVKAATDKDFAFGQAMNPSSADGTIIGVDLIPTYLGI